MYSQNVVTPHYLQTLSMAEEKNFAVKTYRLVAGDFAHRIVHKALGTFPWVPSSAPKQTTIKYRQQNNYLRSIYILSGLISNQEMVQGIHMGVYRFQATLSQFI